MGSDPLEASRIQRVFCPRRRGSDPFSDRFSVRRSQKWYRKLPGTRNRRPVRTCRRFVNPSRNVPCSDLASHYERRGELEVGASPNIALDNIALDNLALDIVALDNATIGGAIGDDRSHHQLRQSKDERRMIKTLTSAPSWERSCSPWRALFVSAVSSAAAHTSSQAFLRSVVDSSSSHYSLTTF